MDTLDLKPARTDCALNDCVVLFTYADGDPMVIDLVIDGDVIPASFSPEKHLIGGRPKVPKLNHHYSLHISPRYGTDSNLSGFISEQAPVQSVSFNVTPWYVFLKRWIQAIDELGLLIAPLS